MISDDYKEAFVWVWLPGETEPVVAGRLEADSGKIQFTYGRSYLERVADQPPAISLYEPELPLKAGIMEPMSDLAMHGCIRDASPDAWGRRVIINKKMGFKGADVDTSELGEMTYLLESGSDRMGALDFQLSPTHYEPRSAKNADLEELIQAAEFIEKGIPLTPELDQALFHGSSLGGARPKAQIREHDKKYFAKFSSGSDLYNVVKAEFIAMRLASIAGLNVAPVKLVAAANKDVLLIERFDREWNVEGWSRKAMISALTLMELSEITARYASYETLAEKIRHRFTDPKNTLKELFSRLVFNILCGNTDDHARNHAAFWNGSELTLTPAYDICPQGRTGNEASQAMLISGNNNLSRLESCFEAANHFLLSEDEARAISDHQINIIEQHWDEVCDEAKLSEVDRKLFWRRQFLNPYSIGYQMR